MTFLGVDDIDIADDLDDPNNPGDDDREPPTSDGPVLCGLMTFLGVGDIAALSDLNPADNECDRSNSRRGAGPSGNDWYSQSERGVL